MLETERLLLRGFRADDLDAQAAMLGDPAVMRHVGGKPITREEAWRKLLAGPGLWALLGYGYWIVERRLDGRYLGQVGFADFKRDMLPSIEGIPEMGWMFAVHAHGQGYAAEAAQAALGWLDGALKGQEVVAIIDPDNHPSVRVAERCGFSLRDKAIYKDQPVLLFRRPAASPAEATAAA